MSSMEQIRKGLTERGIAFTKPESRSDGYTWLDCGGCKTSLIQRDDGTIDLICYGMTAEQVSAFVDIMEVLTFVNMMESK